MNGDDWFLAAGSDTSPKKAAPEAGGQPTAATAAAPSEDGQASNPTSAGPAATSGWGGGAWSFGSLVSAVSDAVKSNVAEVADVYKRDLGDFAHVMRATSGKLAETVKGLATTASEEALWLASGGTATGGDGGDDNTGHVDKATVADSAAAGTPSTEPAANTPMAAMTTAAAPSAVAEDAAILADAASASLGAGGAPSDDPFALVEDATGPLANPYPMAKRQRKPRTRYRPGLEGSEDGEEDDIVIEVDLDAGIQNARKAADALVTGFASGFSKVKGFMSNVITVAPGGEAEGAGKQGNGAPANRALLERRAAVISQLSRDEQVYVLDPPPSLVASAMTMGAPAFEDFKASFDLAAHVSRISKVLREDGELEAMMDRVVPSQVTPLDFWTRYFYRLALIDQEESVRRRVMDDASKVVQGEAEEMGWDSGSEAEEAPSQPAPPAPVQHPVEGAAGPGPVGGGAHTAGAAEVVFEAPVPASSAPASRAPSPQAVDVDASAPAVAPSVVDAPGDQRTLAAPGGSNAPSPRPASALSSTTANGDEKASRSASPAPGAAAADVPAAKEKGPTPAQAGPGVPSSAEEADWDTWE